MRAYWISIVSCVLLVLPTENAADGADVQNLVTEMVAIEGQPFGVAKISLPASMSEFLRSERPLTVSDKEGRIAYSVTQEIFVAETVAEDAPPIVRRGAQRRRLLGRLEKAIRNLTAEPDDRVAGTELWFLFRGTQPLTLEFSGMTSGELTIRPQAATSPEPLSELLNGWWDAYTTDAIKRLEMAGYPKLVDTYLVTMLARRLSLPLPPELVANSTQPENELKSTLETLLGTERMRNVALTSAAIGPANPSALASLVVPDEPRWNRDQPIDVSPDIVTEPTANHVPPECFYLRFGSFTNYLWFRDLSQLYGGDISSMFSLRGISDQGARRAEDQLGIQLTEISRMLGPTLIEDQAIIGTDLYLSEGASLGVLFKTKNAFLLETSLNSDRIQRANRDSDVTLTNEKIADRPVSLLASEDNRVRSFMAKDGNWILVTNSRHLVERFYAVADGEQSLGQTAEFRLARQWMPVDRNDSLFAYFSPGMLRGLLGPKYQIELRRRLHAQADINLIRLARLAAANEGNPLETIESLTAAGYLPSGFGLRADGSGPLANGDEILDSQRGRRGSFIPIADVQLTSVSEEEALWYKSRADFFSNNWPEVDPVMIGIERVEGAGDREQLRIHGEIAPFVPGKYGKIAKQLGPPTKTAIQFPSDDLVAIQAHVVSDQLQGTIPPHHLFAGVKDADLPDPEQFDGVLQTYLALRTLPAYLGAWPMPGLLDRLPFRLGQGVEVEPGLNRLIGGLYRYQSEDFSMLSFQQDILIDSLPDLAVADTDDEAQVRLHIQNLAGTELEGWVNGQLYKQASQMSLAGAAFLNRLSTQLRMAPDQAEAMDSWLLAGDLACPLRGTYTFEKTRRGERWVSSAWDSKTALPAVQVPADYQAPMLAWFRGLQANLTQYEDRLVFDATLDTEHQRREKGIPGPAKPTKPITPADAPVEKEKVKRRAEL